MFSEYASRFLAQSQSRLSLTQTDPVNNERRNPLERPSSRTASHSRLQRQPFGNPYQSNQTSRFPFSSRLSAAAPLFYSATDEFREEDDNEEHEREVADFYALQRSRRDFDAAKLTESSEREDEDLGTRTEDNRRAKGIRSSWTGEELEKQRGKAERSGLHSGSVASSRLTNNPRLVDVELGSTIHEVDESDPPEELTMGTDEDDPPSVQQFRKPLLAESRVGDGEAATQRRQSPDRESVSPDQEEAHFPSIPAKHDVFWGNAYLLCIAAVFATFLLVSLHTTKPSSDLGDTVYTTLHASFYMLAVDTTIATIVALFWLAMLRSFIRPLILTVVVAVPIILFSFSLYPFISSFKGHWHGDSLQDKVMRWFSFIPITFAVFWTYTAYKGRGSFDRAIQLLEFAARILGANASLVLVGFGTLASVVTWTWLWLLMFTRVFLGGHFAQKYFIIDTSTWWLGAFFILTYLWTLSVMSGIQRATTAATVSQWYFHRLAVPAPSSHRVVLASFSHATSTIFGTICLSTLLALMVRLPLLVLPGRISNWLAFSLFSFVPTSITSLTNPLSLTYAAIHSQPLLMSARGLSELSFIAADAPTSTLTPRAFSQRRVAGTPSLLAYRLAKLFLYATRAIAALAFGFGGWVSTARMLRIEGQSFRGSLYAYIVGMSAGAIGWTVLGAMEGVLSGILDAVVICWGSEVGAGGFGQARYCREAGQLLEEGET